MGQKVNYLQFFSEFTTDIAVSQTLSRLVKAGVLERVSKGLYYRQGMAS